MAELHIASCVAYCAPGALERVIASIAATGLAEVPRNDGRGRLVVLIEGATSRAVADVIDAIGALEGVLAVHLAYQHCESESDEETA